jgi:hypothetical protein
MPQELMNGMNQTNFQKDPIAIIPMMLIAFMIFVIFKAVHKVLKVLNIEKE